MVYPSDDESVLCSPDSQPAEEAFEDEFSDDDTTYTRVRQPPPEPSLTIYSAVFKCPLPPCCINETCSAFSKTHVTKSVIPKHVQDEWDQLEAAKLASIYGSVAAPAEDSEDEEDVAANIDYTSELDFGPSKTPVRYLPQLFKSVGEDVNSKTLRKLNKALDTDGNGGVKFADFVTWLYNLRLSRRKWGNRACITDDLPLPRCCNNPACKAHSERPTASDDDEEEERQHHIMWSVFTRHDSDGSGELGLDEVSHRHPHTPTPLKTRCSPSPTPCQLFLTLASLAFRFGRYLWSTRSRLTRRSCMPLLGSLTWTGAGTWSSRSSAS